MPILQKYSIVTAPYLCEEYFDLEVYPWYFRHLNRLCLMLLLYEGNEHYIIMTSLVHNGCTPDIAIIDIHYINFNDYVVYLIHVHILTSIRISKNNDNSLSNHLRRCLLQI